MTWKPWCKIIVFSLSQTFNLFTSIFMLYNSFSGACIFIKKLKICRLFSQDPIWKTDIKCTRSKFWDFVKTRQRKWIYYIKKFAPMPKNYNVKNPNFAPVPKFESKCTLDKFSSNSLFFRGGQDWRKAEK